MSIAVAAAPLIRGGLPGCRVGPISNARESLLLWVHTGTARVATGLTRHELSTGQALWLPPGLEHTVVVDEDSLAVPIFVPAGDVPEDLRRVAVLTIPSEWSDWLVWRYACTLGYLHGVAMDAAGLVELVAGSRLTAAGIRITMPPLPASREALDVARTVLSEPASASTVDEFADRVAVSTRTLQRQFAGETGMGFTRWRTAVRIAAAAALLADGHHAGWAGGQVGIHDAACFTRTFRRQVGLTPSQYARRLRDSHAAAEGTLDLIGTVSTLIQRGSTQAPMSAGLPTPRIPAVTTWECVSDTDIAMWVYRGVAQIRIGGRRRQLQRGDLVWLPADIPHAMELDEDTIVLPVAWRAARGSGLDGRVVRFPDEAAPRLLQALVLTRSALRPDRDESSSFIRALEAADPSPDRPSEPEQRVGVIADRIRSTPADACSLTGWAERLGVDPARLRREFIATTGEPFERWRLQLRMSIARDLLDEGKPLTAVARRLGYAHLSGFSRVFATAFGQPPGAYQRSLSA